MSPLFVDRPQRLQDHAGRVPHVSAFGALIVGCRCPALLESFHTNVLNTVTLTTPTQTNGGTVTVGSGLLTVSAGTNATGAAAIQTRSAVRYRPGYQSQYTFTAMFTTGAAASAATQWIGPLTTQDGFGVGMNNGVFSVVHRRAGVDVATPITSCDIDITSSSNASTFVLDPTKLNIFQIDFGYLGVLDPVFNVYGGKGIGWVAFHQMPFVNTRTTAHVANPTLPLRAEVTKTAGASAVSLKSASWNGSLIGPAIDDGIGSRHGAISATASLSSSTVKLMALIRCNSTYGGVTSYVNSFIQNVGVATDGNRSVQVRLLLNPTLGGTAPSYTDYDATNSVISYDTTLTGVTFSGGRQVAALMVEKSGGGDFDIPPGEVLLNPGDLIAVTAYSAQANTVDVQVEWDELF